MSFFVVFGQHLTQIQAYTIDIHYFPVSNRVSNHLPSYGPLFKSFPVNIGIWRYHLLNHPLTTDLGNNHFLSEPLQFGKKNCTPPPVIVILCDLLVTPLPPVIFCDLFGDPLLPLLGSGNISTHPKNQYKTYWFYCSRKFTYLSSYLYKVWNLECWI